MEIEMVTQLIGNLGFPIFVAIYMLIKQTKDTENMTKILVDLQNVIEQLASKLDKE